MAAGDGLISMTPTSIAHSGTSASINADGGVDFTAVTSLSLNGVFTSDYDNYVVYVSYDLSAGNRGIQYRLRASGSDASTNNYTYQTLYADGSTKVGARTSSASSVETAYGSSAQNGLMLMFYGPALAQPTASRGVDVGSTSGAFINDVAATHSLSTSYDGFTLFLSPENMTGNIHVFGYEE